MPSLIFNIVLLGTLSACAGVPTAAPMTSPSPTPSAATTLQICQTAFASAELLSWAGGTVAQFREYQYGGPIPTRPLAGAFADLPGLTRGSWCGIRTGAETISWWAVVEGREPVKAIDITGPGESTPRGEVTGPPIVP